MASLISACAIVAASMVLSSPTAGAVSPGPLVYSVNPWENGSADGHRGFQPFDAFTGEHIGGAQIVVVDGAVPMTTVDAASGIAINPVSGTAYVLLKGGFSDTQLPRVLATLDLTNGEATTLGNTTKPLTNLAFGNGVLYGVGGRSGQGYSEVADDPAFGHLFTINTTNGSITEDLGQLTNCPGIGTFDSCGHAIAFNPEDGELYHMSGPEENQIFERVILSPSLALEPLTFTSSTKPDMVLGMGWDSAHDRFIMTDWNTFSTTPNVFSVTVDGSDEASALALPKVFQAMKGLAISTDPVPTDVLPVAVDDVLTVGEGDGSTRVDVLANDTNPDGGPESIQSVTQPANGLVHTGSFNSVPMLFYTPDSGYCNDGVTTDDFTYTLNGGSTATVSVTVTCVPFEGPLVFGVNPFGNSDFPAGGGLQAFDAGTGLVEHERPIEAVLPSAVTGDVHNSTALALDPTSGTMYATLAMSTKSTDVLATLDPTTGEAITIGDTGERIAGLTFSAKGTLYAVTTDNADHCFNCLFVVNKATASLKRVKTLSNSGYEAIAYNPLDKKIYRAAEGRFDAIDPARNFSVRDIGYGGEVIFDPYGMGFDPRLGAFWLTDSNADLWQVAPNGGAIETPESSAVELRGLVVSEPTLTAKYSATKRKFKGKLLTPGVGDCDDGRDVSIWRDVTGPDQLVGEATTLEDGSYVLAQRVGKGKYFATVDDAPPVGVFPCPDARSKTIIVR